MIIDALQDILLTNKVFFWCYLSLFALCLGSFLNVVIYRIPIMLKEVWSNECQSYLNLPLNTRATNNGESLNLFYPRSYCPHCKQALRFWQNIPLLSFFYLRGRCYTCQQPISWQYPFVEFIMVLLAVLAAWNFGVSLQTLAALIFCMFLLALAVIDWNEQLLPDWLTFTLLWFGLIVNANGLFATPILAIWGAVMGYCSLWSIAFIYKSIMHKEGMANGDMKLLAAIGAWLGLNHLLAVLVIASLTGSIIGFLWLRWHKQSRHTPIPFGPFLAFAGIVSLLFLH